IHLNSYALADGGWEAPIISVAHSCVYSWWNAVHGCAPGSEWDEYHRRVSRGLRRAAAVVAPSRSMAESIILDYGVERAKTCVIPNFSLASPTTAPKKQPFALAAGRMWDKAKNLVLLESIASDVTWPVYVAGKYEWIKSSSTAPEPFHYLGALRHSELLRRMGQASLFVHPSLYEPFGLAVLEAAMSGCCLVLAAIPSLYELWQGAAAFVDPHNPRAWSSELNRLIADPSARKHFATQAFTRAKRYSAEASVPEYLAVYQNAMQCKHSDSGVAA
ncbi:MAG: glycosyltransferase, partial [Acidobacteriaceae bacterium]|nr:glycosyltransferase [Acidobacteriaceae bacterium]